MTAAVFNRIVQMIGLASTGLVLYGQPELGQLPLWVRTCCMAVAFACGAGSGPLFPPAPPAVKP